MERSPNLNEIQMIWENRGRIGAMEVNVNNILESIRKIENNHLKHMQDSMSNIEDKVQKIEVSIAKTAATVAIIVGVGSVIVQILVERFLVHG